MCNGSSTRISQGGSIAVLHPTSHFGQMQADEDMLLRFSNHFTELGTSVEFQGLIESFAQDRRWVGIVIHRDGNLSASSSSSSSPSQQSIPLDPLYSFSLGSNPESVIQLPQKLDLAVGGTGIIGRRISLMTGSTQDPLTVAEGIIGWN